MEGIQEKSRGLVLGDLWALEIEIWIIFIEVQTKVVPPARLRWPRFDVGTASYPRLLSCNLRLQ